jgi:hypothetical protein
MVLKAHIVSSVLQARLPQTSLSIEPRLKIIAFIHDFTKHSSQYLGKGIKKGLTK